MVPATEDVDEATDGELDRASSAQRRLGTIVAATYRLARHIGSGGSSHVFEAEHVRLGKRFAVKLLRPELDPSRRTAQRFRREARAIARLRSEHVVSVIDCGELADGTPYLVMELLEGEDLRSLLNREGSLPIRRAVPLIIEACRGLSEVHAAGLVHRDLKPENLFLTRRSTGEDWCKVLDFGVARMESSLSTAENAIVGTARYMAPEQLADSAAVGPATDVYALGAILYECASGRALVSGSTVQEVMYRIMNAEPLPLSELAPTLPRALADVIERCLSKSPKGRPSSTDELAALLRSATASSFGGPANNATVAEDGGISSSLPRQWRTRPLLWAGAIAAAATTTFAGWYVRRVSLAGEGHTSPTHHSAAPVRDVAVPPASVPLAPSAPPLSTSASPSSSMRPTPSSMRPTVLGPRPVTSAASPNRIHGFDSANPYTE
jgi:serine/threonine protein kinase